MINIIFGFLIIIGISYALLVGRIDSIGNIIISSSSKTLELSLSIFTFMALWLGIINIANKSGLLNKITDFLKPFLRKLFPEIPSNHESLNYISTNFVTNMFGLGNASTPFAIKAMQSLKELDNTDKASNSMITFLILNTAGLTIIPTTIISLRTSYNGSYSIVFLTLLSSLISLLLAIFINIIFRKVYK